MSDLRARIPPGDDVSQRDDMKPAFSEDLFEQMLQPMNLHRAWQQVRANKGAAGVDGMSIDEFPAWVKSGWMGTGKGLLNRWPIHSQASPAC